MQSVVIYFAYVFMHPQLVLQDTLTILPDRMCSCDKDSSENPPVIESEEENGNEQLIMHQRPSIKPQWLHCKWWCVAFFKSNFHRQFDI